MTVVKMSVHRALAEVKLLDKKLDSASFSAFTMANKVSNKVIGGRSVEEIKNIIKGNFASQVALLENRKRLKSAIVKSNANTEVNVGGLVMTVAEAIERKSSMKYDSAFLGELKRQYTASNNNVESNNSQLPTKLETYLQSVLGNDKQSRSPEDVKMHTKVFEDSNKFELIDPNKISDYIVKLENEINEFLTKVDYTLSESNATTFIDVNFVD